MSIKVSIYEDSNELREDLMELVRSSSDLLLVGAYSHANDIVEQTRKNKPDVILMDIQMPGINGIEATKSIKEKYPAVEVCIQTVFEDNERIFASICAGACGYILKASSPESYINAIIDTYQGGSAMSPSIARKMLGMFKNNNAKVDDFIELTGSEKKVLDLLVQGFSYKLIAAELKISYPTVNFHLKNIYKKLHVNSANEAIRMALNNRLV
ncbi:MAG: response regulator [Leadbetterella sp.]